MKLTRIPTPPLRLCIASQEARQFPTTTLAPRHHRGLHSMGREYACTRDRLIQHQLEMRHRPSLGIELPITSSGSTSMKDARINSPPIALSSESGESNARTGRSDLSRVRVVIADGRAMVAAALAALLERDEQIEVLRHCTSGDQALDAVRVLRPDVLLLELDIPPARAFGLIGQLRTAGLDPRIALVADVLNEVDTMDALRLGVDGIVLSGMPPNLLAQCIHKVAEGGQWIEKVAVGRALDNMLRRREAEHKAGRSLTPREIQVVRLVSEGLRNKDIASELHIGEGTVKVYLNTIYRKLDVHGRVELTRHAQRSQLI